MNAWKARVGDAISSALGLVAARKMSGCRVLMYHAVGGEVTGDAKRLYSIAPELFAAHVRFIAENSSAEAVTLADGVAAGRGLAITFDDGYRDNLTVAAPLLVEAKLPFTVFVTPDFITDGPPQYLSRENLRELARLPGVTIGAHGRSHRKLTACNDSELAAELDGSKAWLEDLLGTAISTMSYPHGAVDGRVRAAAAKAGFQLAACSRFGAHRRGDDPLQVPRTDIWADDPPARLAAKVAGHWDWMGWRG